MFRFLMSRILSGQWHFPVINHCFESQKTFYQRHSMFSVTALCFLDIKRLCVSFARFVRFEYCMPILTNGKFQGFISRHFTVAALGKLLFYFSVKFFCGKDVRWKRCSGFCLQKNMTLMWVTGKSMLLPVLVEIFGESKGKDNFSIILFLLETNNICDGCNLSPNLNVSLFVGQSKM